MKRGLSFRKTFSLMMVVVMCFVFVGQQGSQSVSVEAKTLSQLQQERDALNAKIVESQKKQKEYANQISATQNSIAKEKENKEAIANQIEVTESIITDLDEKISLLEAEISATEDLLVEQEASIVQGVEDFKQRLRAMYLSGNDSMAAILLGSTDFFDMLMKLELCKRVAKHDNDMIESLIDMKNQYEATKLTLETQKTEEEATRAEYQSNKEYLDGLYAKSQDMIDYLAAQEQQYKNMTAAAIKAEEDAEAEIEKVIKQMQDLQSKYVGGTFLWPVPGFNYISSYYGMRWGRLHKGIDIAGKGIYRANIVAANSGKVIYASNSYIPGYSYGKYVIIDHGGTYSTLYGHCDQVLVSVGQTVNRGDVIAKVGTTGNSTGYHLHFEIRVNGVANDPMKWFS